MDYRIPVDGTLFQIVSKKDGSGIFAYYLSGELCLGDSRSPFPQTKEKVEIPIPQELYQVIEAKLEHYGKDSRVFLSGGLEVTVKVPCMN